jgi:soluble lytic murein transglycosylase-like protein
MAAVIIMAAVATTAPTLSSRVEQWRPLMAQAALRFDVPEAWIAAVMNAESRGFTHLKGVPITSKAGAMGLMQLMPGTYRDLARTHGLGPDPYDPRDNIMAGAAYLSAMRARFGYPGLFAAYNAGPARYAAHLRTGQPLPAETQAYIEALAHTPGEAGLPPAVLSGKRLFFRLQTVMDSGDPNLTPAPSAGLFVPRLQREEGGQ